MATTLAMCQASVTRKESTSMNPTGLASWKISVLRTGSALMERTGPNSRLTKTM